MVVVMESREVIFESGALVGGIDCCLMTCACEKHLQAGTRRRIREQKEGRCHLTRESG